MIEAEDESLTWAAAGFNVTLYLTSIDPVHLNIGSVLCPPSNVIPLATAFTARIIVFDIQVPITTGASVRTEMARYIELSLTVRRSSYSTIQEMCLQAYPAS